MREMRSKKPLLAGLACSLLLLVVTLTARNDGRTNDYLSTELRTRVEDLKKTAARPTESLDVLAERLETLWDWGNAYSVTGGPVPVDFPTTVSRNHRVVRGMNALNIGATPRNLSTSIAALAREFQIKDEIPGALGSLTLSVPGPLRAGNHITFDQVYTVGKMPMQPGGGIVISTKIEGSPQSTNPATDGYVSIRCSNPEARFGQARWGRWRGIYLNTAPIAFRLEGAQLKEGDTISVTYGDRSEGSAGIRIQSWSNDRVIFPMYLDLEGKGVLLTPSWPSLEVIGRSAVQYLRAVAPSVARTGERFELTIRSEDRNKNLCSGKVPQYDVFLEGAPYRTISGGKPLTVLKDLSIERPGVYRFEIRASQASGASLRAWSNPVWVQREPEYRVFWGDLHGHTGYAEGQGSPDGYFRFGRDVARLDFISLSEHDIWMDDFEWKTLQAMARKYHRPGVFTPILGYEWTAKNPIGGHHNVYFPTPDGRDRVPLQETADLEELYRGLRARYDPGEVLIVPHAHQAGDWRKSDPKMERLAEITSGHGSFEFFGNKYLENGFEIGFIGSSDNHAGHPGYTGTRNRQQGGLAAVLADENTPKTIFSALRAREAYATTGERILLDVEINGSRMGQRIPYSSARKIECRVMETAPIDSVDLIRNGAVIYSRNYLTSELQAHVWTQLTFESSTEVFSRANPRGARPWVGTVRVLNGKLKRIQIPSFANPATFEARLDDTDANTIHFSMNTRGRAKAILMELEEARPSTIIQVRLRGARERRPSPGAADRPRQTLPAAALSFTLGEIPDGGRMNHEFRVVRNIDRIGIQLVSADGAMDAVFDYLDSDNPRRGDYYYVRARQVDGSMAWSSPFWVGERPENPDR